MYPWLEATYNVQGYRSQLNGPNIFLATPQSNWSGKKRSTLFTPLYYTRITRQKNKYKQNGINNYIRTYALEVQNQDHYTLLLNL
jgi:hypothetical protein